MSTLETNTFDNLIAGSFPISTDRETLTSGQNLERGALLGKITASGATQGELKQCDSASSDGSQTPYAILMEDTDASAADVVCDVYKTGTFNGAAIGLATGDTIDDFKDSLRDVGIIIVTTQEA
jgi:hypothetical protein